ncbi:F420-dependent glucose-6-phosphate dehydrogenase [Frankliniella fusca]|uniref:F420-dependent glucose-6-phosphate dehydrogenase n=1 Tax=Frankliniella fusca TaxID=407009 RepID=A0AAE1LT33_9NEOP|nr:F420-dependent glucose-6-phosphate dehydrogenase [Frankliniella fusca]
MNFAMAYQFFGNSTAKGMQWYREQKHVSQLQDSKPTQDFIEKIDRLAHAINSGGPKGALWSNSEEEKVITDPIKYHRECIALPEPNGRRWFYSDLTDVGLHVTLNSTLEISKYLRDKVGFTYVMTKRLNQDCLEVILYMKYYFSFLVPQN